VTLSDIVERIKDADIDMMWRDAVAEIEWLRVERDLWKERTEQGSLIILENVKAVERLEAENAKLRKIIGEKSK
jgi:hypothetical protein